MAEDRKSATKHNVTILGRENISVTGVLDVLSFDEENIIMDTEMGVLILRGINLHVNRLNLDKGELDIDGQIESLNYEESGSYAKGKSSILGKIFK